MHPCSLFRRCAFLLRLLAFTSGLSTFGTSAAGDPIVISVTGGTASVERDSPDFRSQAALLGTNGFSLSAGGTGDFGWDYAPAGLVVPIGAHIGLHGGRLTFDAREYEFSIFHEPYGGARLWLGGSQFTLPEITGEGSIGAPFVLTGSLNVEDHSLEGPPRQLEFLLTGQGIATLHYGASDFVNGRPLYSPRFIAFEFTPAPVPEPASILLLVAGPGAACVRRWRAAGDGGER